MLTKYGIIKSFSPHAGGGDAEWYCGTADHQSVWSGKGLPALFDTEFEAETRMKGLADELGDSNRELKVSQLLVKEDDPRIADLPSSNKEHRGGY